MKTNKDLVSIICPAYNSEDYLRETIHSIENQDYNNWELIIVDDCSTDDTPRILEYLSKDNDKIKPIFQSKNNGPAVARKIGLLNARGNYIAFCDSDDLWLDSKLSEQLQFMRNEMAAISYTGYRRFKYENGCRVNGHYIDVPEKLNYSELLRNTAIATSTVVINKRMVGDIKIRDCYYDDFVLWLSLLKKGIIAKGLRKDLMRYRVLPKSVSRNKLRSMYEVWQTYRDIEQLSVIKSTISFLGYIKNAFIKYKKF